MSMPARHVLTLLAALWLAWVGRSVTPPGPYVLVDDFNIIFVVLIAFVGFTTSVFSANLCHPRAGQRPGNAGFLAALSHALPGADTRLQSRAVQQQHGRDVGGDEDSATLITVVMVGIYRTHAAIEAAWKYFILASVGVALALFGTILVYMAAEPAIGSGPSAMVWTNLVAHAASLEPAMLNLAFVFLLLGYGTKVGLFPLHAWLPDAHAEGRLRSPRCCRACCSTSRSTRCCAARCSWMETPRRSRPAR